HVQRLAKSFRECWSAVHARKLAAVAECWMQFEHPRGCSPCFLDTPELGERCCQLQIGNAVRGIGLNGLVGGAAGFFIAAAQQVTHRLRVECGPSPRIETAVADASTPT